MEGVFNADDDDENQHATYSLHTRTLSTLHATRYTLHATRYYYYYYTNDGEHLGRARSSSSLKELERLSFLLHPVPDQLPHPALTVASINLERRA